MACEGYVLGYTYDVLGVVAEATLELLEEEVLVCEDDGVLELETLAVDEAEEVESTLLVVETSDDVDSVDEDTELLVVGTETVDDDETLLVDNVCVGFFTTGPAQAPLYAAREPSTVDTPETSLSSVQESATLTATQSAVVSQRAWQLSREATVASRL